MYSNLHLLSLLLLLLLLPLLLNPFPSLFFQNLVLLLDLPHPVLALPSPTSSQLNFNLPRPTHRMMTPKRLLQRGTRIKFRECIPLWGISPLLSRDADMFRGYWEVSVEKRGEFRG